MTPLAGQKGVMTTRTSGDLRGPYSPRLSAAFSCYLFWNKETRAVIEVAPSNRRGLNTPPGSHATVLGPGISEQYDTASSYLYFRCSYRSAADTEINDVNEPYILVDVSALPAGLDRKDSPLPVRKRQALADMALDIARNAARSLPCSNKLSFPSTAPRVPDL